jgi:hypothetical protein
MEVTATTSQGHGLSDGRRSEKGLDLDGNTGDSSPEAPERSGGGMRESWRSSGEAIEKCGNKEAPKRKAMAPKEHAATAECTGRSSGGGILR